MPQTARIEDIEEPGPIGRASIDDIIEEPEYLPEVKQAIVAVPRPKAPEELIRPRTPRLVLTSPYSPGSPGRYEPLAGTETPESEEAARLTTAAAQSGAEQGAGVGGYPKIVSGAKKVAEAGIAPGSSYYTPPQHIPSPEERHKAAAGVAELASGVGEASTPLIGEAAGAQPVKTALGFGAGYAASRSAGALVHGSVSPETEEMIRQLAFWAPGVAATLSGVKSISTEGPGVKGKAVSAFGGRVGAVGGITPDAFAAGIKVGPFEGGMRIPRTRTDAPLPTQPALNGEVAPPPTDIPQPTVPHPGAPVDNIAEGASNAVAMANEEAQAMRIVSGLPPTPPPPPAPPAPQPPIPQEAAGNSISPQDVQKIGGVIAKVPPELRPQAIIEAHQTLSQSILQQGKFVTPSGTLEIVTKPEQADKLAQRIINDEVKRVEKEIAEKAKESGQTKGAGPATTEAAPLTTPAKSIEQHIWDTVEKKKLVIHGSWTDEGFRKDFDVPEGASLRKMQEAGVIQKNSEGLWELGPHITGENPQLQGVQTAHIDQIEEAPRTARIEDIEEPASPATGAGHETEPETPEQAVATTESKAQEPQASRPVVSVRAERGTAALTDLAPTNFLKGDQVVLPNGAKATVAWVSQKMSIVRVKTDDGQVLSIGARKLKSVRPEPVTPTGWMAEKENVPARPISQPGKSPAPVVSAEAKPAQPPRNNNSTQINVPEEVATRIKAAGQSIIPDKDLAPEVKGREDQPHITVKYGVNDQAADVLREKLAEHPPFDATLGKIRTFPASENSDGAAVVHVEVNSPDLKKLHAEVDKHVGSKKDDFDYKPHVTLAYVKPEVAHKYEGRSDLEGTKIPVNAITVSQKDGKQVEVPLRRKTNTADEAPARPEKTVAPSPETESKIEAAHEHIQSTRAVRPAAGGRPLRATEGNGRGELAGEQPQAGEGTREVGKPGEDTGVESVAGNHRPPAVRSEGDTGQPGPGARLRGPSESERAVELKSSPKTTPKNTDWFQHPKDFSVDATEGKRLEWNMNALKVLKRVEAGEKLTDADRDALAHYVGWGALQNAFDPYKAPWDQQRKWNEAFKQLQEYMTPEEIDAARRSTQNAHYTSPQMVRFTWNLLSRMGFKGGVILEPSMGTGNFFGMMPTGMRTSSQAIGNELDPSTYKIAQLLYPGATMFNKDFVELMLPNDSIDLAISNVPFGVKIYDKNYPKLKASIHDYFFVKSLDKVRPGGVVSFITSTFTMDKQRSDIRELLADKGDLMYALRFPQETFGKSAGTSVATDLLVIRKRIPGEEPQGEPFFALRDVTAPYAKYHDKAGSNGVKQINEYFAVHPENVIGDLEIGRGRTTQDPDALVVMRSDDFDEQLEKAQKAAPRNVYLSKRAASPIFTPGTEEAFAPDTLEEGNYTVDDKGEIKQRVNGKLVDTTVVRDKDGRASFTLKERMRRLIAIRNGTRELMRIMNTVPDDKDGTSLVEHQQAKLRKLVEEYQQNHGYFAQRKTKDVFEEDPHYPLILSLEDYDKFQKAGTSAPILTRRTIYPPQRLTSLSSDPKEALSQVLGERGFPDMDFMSGLAGKSVEEIAKPLIDQRLIYQNPVSGLYETRDKYLSGYVREKLADAKLAVEQGNKQYEVNVRELEKVQPPTVPINSGDPNKDMQIKLGGTWIEPRVIRQFGVDVLKGGGYAEVKYADGSWRVDHFGSSAENTSEFAGGGMSGEQLLELALNQKQALVRETYKDEHGTERSVVNQDKTIAARRAQQKVKEEFAKWARAHKTIGEILEKAYNEKYNNIVTPAHNGSHLTFPGMNKSILRDGKLAPHQVDAIWRIIQDGRALLAHVVGAGKTFEMIGSAMELKRLGMVRKPMFAVPNHLVGQWAQDFLRLYPGAKVLVPLKNDFTPTRRNKIMSRIATGDWDAVILPHSQFDMMDISPERQKITLNKELDELEEAYSNAKATEGKKGYTVKRLEKARDRLRAKIAELSDLKADKTVRFDDLGVDHLVVDEAHAYKNLAFYTKMERVAGLAQGNSKRATRVKMKTDYLLEKHGNRGVVFATGTPIQNTMAEMYNMTKYLAPDVLEKAGIKYFDEWAANFGDIITAMELSTDGRTYKARSKFAQFTNVPELQMMFRSFADVKTKEDLDLPVPAIEGGSPQPLTAHPSPELEMYVRDLIARARACRGEATEVLDERGKPVMVDEYKDGKPTGRKVPEMRGQQRPDPRVDNMLKVTGDGRKAATDMRLIDPNMPDDPDSKINTIIDKIHEEWKLGKHDPETGLKNLTGLVFLDNYQYLEPEFDTEGNKVKGGKGKALLNLYRDMADKLVAKGVPREEMAVIHDYPKQEQKLALFAAMNEGKVRILFGSTQKMGAGMNAQQRMRWMIDADSPWRPGDLEQRHGRIIRQGNLNKSVRLYHAVTKGTFDSYMIQTLKTKAEFINQVMSGKFTGRTMTDAAGDMVLSLEEMLAASSNNPDVKKKMELDAEVASLQSLERQWEAGQYKRQRDAEQFSNAAARLKAGVEAAQKVADTWNKATEGDKFALSILGKKFDKYGDANEWLKDQAPPVTNFHFEMNGVPIRVEWQRASLMGDEPAKLSYTVEPWDPRRLEAGFHSLITSSYSFLNPNHVAGRIQDWASESARLTEKSEKLSKLAENGNFEDADRLKKAKQELEAAKKRLGLSDEQGAQEQDVAAAVDSTPDVPEEEGGEEADDEGAEPESVAALLKGEGGTFEPGAIGKAAKSFFGQDVQPALDKAGVGLRDTAALFVKGFYPRIEESNPVGRWLKVAAPSDAVDVLMKLKGGRAKALGHFDGIMAGLEKMFDRLPESERVNFIHAMQTGGEQASPELRQIADLFKTIQEGQRNAEQEALNLGRSGQELELSRKENYFHNWWNTPPGKEPAEDDEQRISRLTMPRRPLEGSKGYNKKQSYTLKEGIAAGGKPETTNPVRIMRHRIEDGLKFVTARRAWQGLHDLDLRVYVTQGQRAPAGFDKIDDRIAKVYFPASIDFPGRKEPVNVPHQLGEWYVEANTARLLNNMLSRDRIRETAAGRSLMWLKNASTALELGLSPFHAVFETIEAASSQLALGMQRSFNLGIRGGDPAALAKGILEMATSPLAPITMAREGGALPAYIEARSRLGEIGIAQFGKHQIEGTQPHGIKEAIAHFGEVRKVAGIRRLLKQYPDLDQLVDDMFTGGLIIGQHRDYQTRAFGKTAAEAWSADNHLGAILRAGISIPQTMMKPLFQVYIPNLKYSLFLKMMSEQAAEHAAELEDGSLTRAALARRVADSAENRFGELNFDNLFLKQTIKTGLQFMFRSVTYKMGTAREIAGAAGGQAAELANWARQAYDSEYRESAEAPGALPRLDLRASWVAALIITTVAMGAIASKLLSGKYPWEYIDEDKKEGKGDPRALYLETVHPRTGEKDSHGKPVRISLPTYWKDVEHLFSNPKQYVLSSLSGILSKGMDLAENHDYFGNYVYNPHAKPGAQLEQAGKYAFPMPFSVSNYRRGQQMGEPKTAWLSAFGFPRAPSDLDFTPAEKALRDVIKASRSPATPEQMEAWRAKREAYHEGKLSAREAREFIKRERESFLEKEFKNSAVTYIDAVRIHNLATPQEKPLLDRLLAQKRLNQLRRHGAGNVQRKEAEAAQ